MCCFTSIRASPLTLDEKIALGLGALSNRLTNIEHHGYIRHRGYLVGPRFSGEGSPSLGPPDTHTTPGSPDQGPAWTLPPPGGGEEMGGSKKYISTLSYTAN